MVGFVDGVADGFNLLMATSVVSRGLKVKPLCERSVHLVDITYSQGARVARRSMDAEAGVFLSHSAHRRLCSPQKRLFGVGSVSS